MTTLVTSYINYYQTPLENSTHYLRLSRFKPLLQLNVYMCIFVTSDCTNILHQYIQRHCPQFQKHIKLIVLKSTFFESSQLYVVATRKGKPTQLPTNRFPPKDTFDYMCYTHAKFECLKQATQINPFHTEFFTWIDYDTASSLFQDSSTTLGYLRMVLQTPITNRHHPPTEHESLIPIDPKHHLYIPGCWSKHISQEFSQSIHWRFCGYFLFAHHKAIECLWSLYETHFVSFLQEYNTMVWDVNFLAWLEHQKHWKPIWYQANHNDTLVRLPPYVFSETLYLFATNIETYSYPSIKDFTPSSGSYTTITYRSRTIHILNTKYVNYHYLDNGKCHVNHPDQHRYIKNVMCLLTNEHTIEDASNSFVEMEESATKMKLSPNNHSTENTWYGMEDIRLFQDQVTSKLQFVATTMNYSPEPGHKCIVSGEYNIERKCLENCCIVDPPFENGSGKNWIPFVSKKEPKRPFYIYKWSDVFQIGEHMQYIDVDEYRNKLQITHQCRVKSPLFEYYSIQGSSNIIWTPKGYIGLVHFCVENTAPNQYYHMLVLLDTNTYFPKAHSKLFHFYTYGLESCLSMWQIQDHYKFWISRQDRDPVCLEIPCSILPFDFKIETHPL